MKLTLKQLKQIIKEEVTGTSSFDSDDPVLVFVEQWANSMPYRDDDPSMSAYGPEAWDEQVASASMELQDKLSALLSEIETKLNNGEYAARQLNRF